MVGVTKAGTTSLHTLLDQHPNISMSRVKEPHFFTDKIVQTNLNSNHSQLIRSQKEYAGLFERREEYLYYGEASPSYFWDEGSAAKIFAYNSKSKIVIILRDPIARAFSHYHMDFEAGRETNSSFLQALKKDSMVEPRIWGTARLYLDLGFYATGIDRFRTVFGPENVKVFFFESFFDSLEDHMKQIWHFLGLPPHPVDSKIENQSTYHNSITKTLKKTGLGKHLPSSLKKNIKKISTKKNPTPSQKEISFLYDTYKLDLQKMQSILGTSFYGDHFAQKYDLRI